MKYQAFKGYFLRLHQFWHGALYFTLIMNSPKNKVGKFCAWTPTYWILLSLKDIFVLKDMGYYAHKCMRWHILSASIMVLLYHWAVTENVLQCILRLFKPVQNLFSVSITWFDSPGCAFCLKHCINVDVYHIQNVQNMKINKARFKSVFGAHPLLLLVCLSWNKLIFWMSRLFIRPNKT